MREQLQQDIKLVQFKNSKLINLFHRIITRLSIILRASNHGCKANAKVFVLSILGKMIEIYGEVTNILFLQKIYKKFYLQTLFIDKEYMLGKEIMQN